MLREAPGVRVEEKGIYKRAGLIGALWEGRGSPRNYDADQPSHQKHSPNSDGVGIRALKPYEPLLSLAR